MEGQRSNRFAVVYLVFLLAAGAPAASYAADAASHLKRAAAEWERCARDALATASREASKEDRLDAARRSCQSLKNATLALVADTERANMSASMDAALANFVE